MATGIPFGWVVQNAAGTAASGAKIFFYVPGTTTLRSPYTDSALTVPSANPVVADSAGWFLVYLSSELGYDIVVKSGDESITYQGRTEASNISGAQPVDPTLSVLAALGLEDGKIIRGTGVDTGELIHFDDYTNVRDYGAVGDGIANDTAALQAAITAANSTTHKRIYFPAGTYKYTAQLLWHNGVTWFGDGPTKSIIKLDSSAGNIVGIRTNATSNLSAAQAITSLTSVSTTATATTAAAHGYTTGDIINVIGATEIAYTGSFTITVTGPTTFTYTFRGSGTSPATGTITCTPLEYRQSSLTLRDLHFQGFNAVLTTTPGQTHAGMLRAFSVENLLIERCKFSDHKHILLAMGGCKNTTVRDCEFTTFGREPANWNDGTLPNFDGGAAWWMAANPLDNSPSLNAVFETNNVHDGDGAVYMMGQNVRVVNNYFKNLAEGPYNRRLDVGAESNESERFVFAFNTVEGVTSVWVQASGIELGSKSAIIAFNTFRDCKGPAIDISDVCEDVLVIGNQCLDCAYFTGTTPDGSSTITQAGSIWVRSTSYTTNVPSGIKIINNTIRSSAGNYGIRLYDTAGGVFTNILISGNDLVGAAADPNDILVYDTSDLGTNVSIRNNQGVSDYVPATTSWTPTVTSSTGTITTVTTPTARYWREGAVVFFTLSITVTNNGTGSGLLRFTLPTTPARSGACYGNNTVTGVASIGSWAASNPLVTANTATGAYPVASGQTLRISGFYLEA